MISPGGDDRRGVFVLSLDFELIWGTLDLFGPDGFRAAVETERRVAIDRLLDVLVRHRIPATWCIVGHLFLDRCARVAGVAHPEIVRPRHSWHPADWFFHDPTSDEVRAPLFYGRSLIEKIRACAVTQEIASHSFAHVIYGDAGCSREAARTDLRACLLAAEAMGVQLRSFAFPRNRVGHLEVLREGGIICYRGAGRHWYEQDDQPGVLARLAHLWDVVWARSPATVLPEETREGLWNLPGSMIYFPMHGVRRYVPVGRRVLRARKGIDRAAAEGRVFHLWFHPTNLADQTEAMFEGLEEILREVAARRDAGHLETLTMAETVAWASRK